MSVTIFIFILTILTSADHILGLIELPSIHNNDIIVTENAIRDTTNKLFDHLQLRPTDKQTTRLKQFSAIHNYLVSLTLKEYDNLKEIAKIASVDNGNDKAEQFIDVINDILNEIPDETENASLEEADIDKDVIDTIDEFLKNLNVLKHNFSLNRGAQDLNKELFQHVTFDSSNFASNPDLFANLTFYESDSEEENTTADNNDEEFWQPSGRRIYQGERTKIKYFPFMASVAVFGQFQCAGSIIKSDLIITASSCLQLAYNNRFFRENPKFLSVRVGSSWYYGGGEVIPVLEVYFHPGYDPKTLNDNLALMRLHRWIKFSKHSKRVKKIRLDKHDNALPYNTNGIAIAGWGAMSSSNKLRNPWYNQLSYAILDIYGLQDCKDVYTSTYVTRRHFCAGFMSKGSGACNRDVGGPGIADGVLMGVISFGSPVCGAADTPTVFTKVGYYYDWIETIMEQKVPEAYALTTPRPPLVFRYLPDFMNFPKNPRITPVTRTKTTQYPTWALSSEEMATKSAIPEEKKIKLFEQFLNSVYEANEYHKGLKKKEYLSIDNALRLDDAPKIVEKDDLKGSNAIGQTVGADVNERIPKDPKVPRITPPITYDEDEEELRSPPTPSKQKVIAKMVTSILYLEKEDGQGQTGISLESKEVEMVTPAAENNEKLQETISLDNNNAGSEEFISSKEADDGHVDIDESSEDSKEHNVDDTSVEENNEELSIEIVPNSKELEHDNALTIANDLKNGVGLSVDVDNSAAPEGTENESNEAGLSVASLEDLTLRLRNNTPLNLIFDIPKEQLYDLISDRMVKAAVPNAAPTDNMTISGTPVLGLRGNGRIF